MRAGIEKRLVKLEQGQVKFKHWPTFAELGIRPSPSGFKFEQLYQGVPK